MLKRFSTFLAASALVTLAACGGGDGGPNWADEVDETTATEAADVAAEMATTVANSILEGSVSSELPFGFVKGTESPSLTEQLLARARRQLLVRSSRPELANAPSPFRVSAVCEPVISGQLDELEEPIDSDEDGIPNDVTVTFPSGCTEVDGDDTYTYSGSLRYRDVAGLYGYRLDLNNLRLRVSGTWGYEQVAGDGFETGVYSSSAITHDVDMTQTLSLRYEDAVVAGPMTVAPLSITESFRWIESAAYDPDGTITFEAEIPNGDLTFDIDMRRQFDATDGEESVEMALRFTMTTTDPLAIDNVTCNGPTDGTIVGDLNGNDAVGFTINWSACDTYTITVRGTTEPEGPVLE